jgi:predicted RNA-binding Zn-ribbon protein involved in translation (DUF1610 family)
MIYSGWKQIEVKATGAICPVPGCGALTIAYRSADSGMRSLPEEPCHFVCDQCGFEFLASGRDLLFQSVPRDWLLAQISHA